MPLPDSRATACVLALVFVLAAAPAAAGAAPVVAGQPVNDGLFIAALRHADAWWTAQGSPPPCGDSAAHARWGYPPGADPAIGDTSWAIAPCDTWFTLRYQRFVRGFLQEGNPRRYQLVVVATLCAMADHEVGHLIGYGHDAGGVMSPAAPVPGDCYQWAAGIVEPRTASASRRAHHHAGRRRVTHPAHHRPALR